jgi:hypothetical protein
MTRQIQFLDFELIQTLFFSGGKAKNGAPILTIPDNQDQKEISDEDYRKIICYLCCVPP